jgi:hypothetical protein
MQPFFEFLARWGTAILRQGPPSRFEVTMATSVAVAGAAAVVFSLVQGAALSPLGAIGLVLFVVGLNLLQSNAARLAYHRLQNGQS